MYCMWMNLVPQLKTGNLVVALTNQNVIISNLIAELALRGPAIVLDSGNCFPAYRIAQLIRRKSLQLESISRRIFIQRSFTCYQMTSLLENTPAVAQPHVILNLLTTFQDDQVKPDEAGRLLTICLSHIERLSLVAPVAITLEPAILAEKEFLLKRVCEQADEVFTSLSEPSPQEQQLSFFGM
ncbi:hypothetical protein ANAEL_04595 [Anaerolineales bacterium]|nr:hypothetical protein ANAEL_04595 [Anaerolineales bacterium]